MIRTDVLIIGAGLTGLTLQYLLRNQSKKVLLVEARDRIGGRIHTFRDKGGPSIEMGATWLGGKHTRLNKLLRDLEIPIFPQELGSHAFYEWISTSPPQLVELPKNEEPSYRIRGGTDTVIDKLAGFLDPGQLYLGVAVQKISLNGNRIQVTSDREIFEADLVISTLPPYLLHKKVRIDPGLPPELTRVMEQTHTWMGESIKFGLGYDKTFWRDANSSGTVFSNVGPVSEMYDHSGHEQDSFALKGFFNPAYHALDKAERLGMILSQLRKYYGNVVDDYTTYQETAWAHEPYTFFPYQGHIFPHQHNGHAVYRESYMNGKLFVAGSETADLFPGYMEGAVRSAELMRDWLEGISS
jgi:monoamine oxidase